MKCQPRPYSLALRIGLWIVVSLSAAEIAFAQSLQPRIVEVRKIWHAAPHNAFTDLVRWKNQFYCAFREGKGHAGDLGKLRVLRSADGERWESAGLLAMDAYDLRDAALSVTPDQRLMVLGGAQQNAEGQRATGTFVSFSQDGKSFSQPKLVIGKGRWLWRVTWHGKSAFGVSYGSPDNPAASALLKTTDGEKYEVVTDSLLAIGGRPTEARLRFDQAGNCLCLHRRDGDQNTAYLGVSQSPYKKWKWHDLGIRFGGPNFLQLPNGVWIAAGRLYDGRTRTSLATLDPDQGKMEPLLELPSGGDTSYPGMVWHDGMLWVSYYSSHEGRTSIYLAKIEFPSLVSAIPVANRLEPLVDQHLVESLQGADHRLHAPRPAESVLKFDKPWEGAFCGYATVLKTADKFRIYYRGLPKAGGDGSSHEVTCYAESQDGVRWSKPDLGIYEINGSKANNVVLKGETPASHNFSPFFDSNPAVAPEHRFKALGGTAKGLIAFTSPDGLHWKRIQQEPVFTKGVFDSQNVSFYSVAEQKYVCYFRTWSGRGYRGYRTISRTTSPDFVHWSEPVAMTFGKTPPEHLYTNQTSPYFRAPHLSLGIAARFMPGRQVITPEEAQRIGVNPKYFGDISDAVLLSTRGGNRYDRTFMESFIRPGIGLENWVSRTNYPALGIVQTGPNELSLYVQKNYGQPTSFLKRYTLRLDGFASIHAGYQPGEMLTKPLNFSQGSTRTAKKKSAASASPKQVSANRTTETIELRLNYSTSAAGSIKVELQDASGAAIPGFAINDCDTLIGDQIDQVVRWRGKSNLADLSDQPIRVRFKLQDADLYSLQFR